MKLLKLEKIVAQFSKDVGYDKTQILRFLLGDKYEGNRAPGALDAGFDPRHLQGAHAGAHSGRPQSHHEALSSRRNLETGTGNTGMAAKLAYNNL